MRWIFRLYFLNAASKAHRRRIGSNKICKKKWLFLKQTTHVSHQFYYSVPCFSFTKYVFKELTTRSPLYLRIQHVVTSFGCCRAYLERPQRQWLPIDSGKCFGIGPVRFCRRLFVGTYFGPGHSILGLNPFFPLMKGTRFPRS